MLQKLREQVIIMKEYFLKCGDALRSKLLVQVTQMEQLSTDCVGNIIIVIVVVSIRPHLHT